MLSPNPCCYSSPARPKSAGQSDYEKHVVSNNTLLNFNPLRDDQKLDLIWRISNALTDPARNPCMIIFYSPSQAESKSLFAININKVLGAGVRWKLTDLVHKTSRWLSAGEVMSLAEKGIIVYDECGIEEGMNCYNVKKWISSPLVHK